MMKATEYAKKMRTIADLLEDLRCEIWQNSIDEEKEEFNNTLFKTQSDLRSMAEYIEYCDFRG